jgi:hypothetical protein
MIRKIINYINKKTHALIGTGPLSRVASSTDKIGSVIDGVLLDSYLESGLFGAERYTNSKRITHFHRSVYTQNGEDGIIEEIFNRIGLTNKYFVEFGVHGVKNNSTYLLVQNWNGVWIGGSRSVNEIISSKFRDQIASKQLILKNTWITKDNIEAFLRESKVPESFDFLSIDLDGNDFWIWEAIRSFSPRVVAIEYNATFPPHIRWVMAYNEHHIWDQSSYFGASLKSLELLGESKGYKLVGCDFSGCNAFFVRSDQKLDSFESSYSAEFHYEPARYFVKKPSGHLQNFGPFSQPR